MGGQEDIHRRRDSSEGNGILHEVCDDYLPQGDLPKDLGILRTVARYNQVTAGVYASVERGGKIKRMDLVWME